jgi:hypothetical protein
VKTPAIAAPAADPLAPIRATLAAMAARPDLPSLNGIAPDLTVRDQTGWTPATALVSGEALDDLLDTAKQRWSATPHAAAALAWKCYSYWLALPAVLGYAAARRVPLLRPEGVVARWSSRQPFMTVGITSIEVAVLPSDPLAAGSRAARRAAGITVLPDEEALLGALRTALMDEHLTPLLEAIHTRLHLGRRILWGSLASGVAHGLSRATDVLPGSTLETAAQVLAALGVDDLVELSPRVDGPSGLSVQRKTCCLAFTLPEPKICSGCCIR